MDNTDGRKWARFFLILALVVSVIGNVTHTWLAESDISLWLRVPGAVIWPVFTWGAIEIVVRVIWEKRKTHTLARTAVLFPAIPAAITSYEHLYNLLGMMGERTLIQWIGPAAIDGLMIGCTLTLLFTREIKDGVEAIAPITPAVPLVAPIVATVPAPQAPTFTPEVAPVSAAPVSPAPQAETKTRAPRGTWNAREVCEMAIDNVSKEKATEKTGIAGSTYDRYRRVARTLKADPMFEIPQSWKVPAEHVRIMREMTNR